MLQRTMLLLQHLARNQDHFILDLRIFHSKYSSVNNKYKFYFMIDRRVALDLEIFSIDVAINYRIEFIIYPTS